MSFEKRDCGCVVVPMHKVVPCEFGLVELEDELESSDLEFFVVSTDELLPPAVSFWRVDCPVSSSSFSSSLLFFGNNASRTSCFILTITEPEEGEGNFRLGMVLLVEGGDMDVMPEETVVIFFTPLGLS